MGWFGDWGVARGRTRLLCWTDSGTRGLIKRDISCFVGGILDSWFFWVGSLYLVSVFRSSRDNLFESSNFAVWLVERMRA